MNKQTSHHFETHAGHEISIWKSHVNPEKPVDKKGKRLKGGVWRHTWVGYVDNTCIAAEHGWHGGTKAEATAKCRAWAEALERTSGQFEAVKALLAKHKAADSYEIFPLDFFVADLNNPALDAEEVRDQFLAERRKCLTEIGAYELL